MADLLALPDGAWLRVDRSAPGGAQVVQLSDRITQRLEVLLQMEREGVALNTGEQSIDPETRCGCGLTYRECSVTHCPIPVGEASELCLLDGFPVEACTIAACTSGRGCQRAQLGERRKGERRVDIDQAKALAHWRRSPIPGSDRRQSGGVGKKAGDPGLETTGAGSCASSRDAKGGSN